MKVSDSWAKEGSSHNLMPPAWSSWSIVLKACWLSKDFNVCDRMLDVLPKRSVKSITVTRKYCALLLPSEIPWIPGASGSADNARRDESRQARLEEVTFRMGCDRLPSSFSDVSFGCKQQTTNKLFGAVRLATAVCIFPLIVDYYLLANVLVTVPLLGIHWGLHLGLWAWIWLF